MSNTPNSDGRGESSRWAEIAINPIMGVAVTTWGDSDTAQSIEMTETVSESTSSISDDVVSVGVQTSSLLCPNCKYEIHRMLSRGSSSEELIAVRTVGCNPWASMSRCLSESVNSLEWATSSGMSEQAPLNVWTTTNNQNTRGTSGDESMVRYGTIGGTGSGETALQISQMSRQSVTNSVAAPGNFCCYMRIMNGLFISPCGVDSGNAEGFIAKTKKIICSICSICSVIQSVRVVKHYTMLFLAEAGNVASYVTFIFYDMRLLTKLNFLHLYTFRQPKIAKVVKCLEDVQEKKQEFTNKKPSRLVGILLTIFSIFMLIGRLLFGGYDFKNPWSMEKTVEESAAVQGAALLAWNPKTYKNDTTTIKQEYASGMNTTTVLLAAASVPTYFFGWAQDRLFVDSLLTITIDLHFEMSAFVESISKKGADAAESAEQKQGKLRWLMSLRALVDATNDAYGKPMIWNHGDNLLLMGQAILSQMNHDSQLYVIFCSVNCIKSIVTYIYAYKIRNMNEPILNWLKKNKDMTGVVDEDGREMSVAEIIEDLERKPIGLGLSGAVIDAGFLKQFGTAAISLFLFMASNQDKKLSFECQCNCNGN